MKIASKLSPRMIRPVYRDDRNQKSLGAILRPFLVED